MIASPPPSPPTSADTGGRGESARSTSLTRKANEILVVAAVLLPSDVWGADNSSGRQVAPTLAVGPPMTKTLREEIEERASSYTLPQHVVSDMVWAARRALERAEALFYEFSLKEDSDILHRMATRVADLRRELLVGPQRDVARPPVPHQPHPEDENDDEAGE